MTKFKVGERVRVTYEGTINGHGFSTGHLHVVTDDGKTYSPHERHVTRIIPPGHNPGTVIQIGEHTWVVGPTMRLSRLARDGNVLMWSLTERRWEDVYEPNYKVLN